MQPARLADPTPVFDLPGHQTVQSYGFRMPRPTPKGERARASILDAAQSLFAQGGFYGTSVRDVAGELGIPTASLLHHFPRKERLYGEVLGRMAVDLGVALDKILQPKAQARAEDYADKLRLLIRRFWRWASGNPDHCRLLLREVLDNEPRIGEAKRLVLAPVLEQFSTFIRAGQAAGAFRDIDPLMFVIHLTGSTSYFVTVLPTLQRLANRSSAALTRDYRRDLVAMIERVVLVEA